MYKLNLPNDKNLTRTKYYGICKRKLVNPNSEAKKIAKSRKRIWCLSAFPSHGILPVDRGRYPSASQRVTCPGREGAAGMEGQRLLGLKWYWGLPLGETVGGLLLSHVLRQWHSREVSSPIYLACRG